MKTEDSQYNWLLKLFQTGNYENIIRSCFNLLVIYFYSGQANVRLIMDRTNWKFGEKNKNILTIGLLLEDNATFIPLIWKDLAHKGNSSQEIRLEL